MDLAARTFVTLSDDGDVARASRAGSADVLVTTLPASQLERAWSLRGDLDHTWAAVPLEISDGRLVSHDPGGDLLVRDATTWSLERSLQIAIGIAAALRQLHARGLVHKDIKPANVIVGRDGVWLTGFGLTSRLPRERQPPVPPEVIEGTLAYMAPEQTGRMNRSIDSRSDLYALGVTLYELLVGVLPFTASDPMEWVHCHIARQPAPLRHATRTIPRVVTAIVMKLLAKTAEARYQTAHGVEQDLRRALVDPEPFELGEHDASDRLLIPEKLYGRDREISVLLSSFERVVERGTTELVLVSGYSGIGKSSVVNELHRVLVPPRGLYAAGKFDQYKRDIPYATLAQAFHTLIRHVLGRNATEVADWRDKLTTALGGNGQLITNLVPELELVIGKQPAPAEIPPEDAHVRFQSVVCRFLGVFAQPEHPLALFLDDLQWLDAATLALLEHLVANPDVRNLLLVGAYRENEVDPSHPLARTLERIGAHRQIVLAPLEVSDIAKLCADALHTPAVQPLAELVHEKTGGNPFFAIQFITSLVDERMVSFEAGAWRWDIDAIRAKQFTDNIVELMAGKLSRLPEPTRRALGQLACLGNHASAATLAAVYGNSDDALHDAVIAGLVSRANGNYAFVHDRVHEAAYATIPVEERASEHLRIGTILAERGDDIFEIVNHLNRGTALITSMPERIRVAELNAQAGLRAKASMAHAAAYTYNELGRSLVDWEHSFRLGFDLELQLAECEFLLGDLQKSEDRLDRLAGHARDLTDRAAVIYLQTTLYTAMVNRTDRAVQICLEYLRRVGIDYTPHPSPHELREEYDRLVVRVAGRSAGELLMIPLATSAVHKATLEVLIGLLTPAFNSDHNLASLILCKVANLSFEHGYTNSSAIGFAFLGMVSIAVFDNYELATEVGTLAVALAETRGLTRYRGRIHHALGCHVLPWTQPLTTAEASLRHGMQVMRETGDVTYSGFAYCALITNLLGSGEALEIDLALAEEGIALMRKVKFEMGADIMLGHLRLVHALRGQLADPSTLDVAGRVFAGQLSECMFWVRTMQSCFLFGNPTAAFEAAQHAERRISNTPGFFERPEYFFYMALVRAQLPDATEQLPAIADARAQLAHSAKHCPQNFTDRVALIDAEVARVEGRHLEAMDAYERAIRAARDNGYHHHEAIAYELAARFYAARGFDMFARTYYDRARAGYARWGAIGKVRQLDQLHAPTAAPTTNRTSADLDLATVVKTSEAVTTELSLDKLIETLMVIALEHAGAERGLLILPRNGELHIEAEAETGAEVTVRRRRGLARHPELPETIIHYVSRSQELVLLDDAQAANDFSADPYLRRSRSVVCVPLVKQAELIGLLYLENNLTPHVFTSARIAVLKLLASQAATSLENATLEEQNATLSEKESLLKEVHHRVKNNLQLISSLLNLQASRVSDPAVAELFAESRNRVRAMALVHENLYRAGNFARIPMATHIRTLCAHLTRAYGLTGQSIELVTNVGDVHLEMNRAVSCGLIINELLSNALKHAFPDGRAGRVWVELRAEGDSTVLIVGDDGVGLPSDDQLRTDSLGLQLVRDLTDQLHGTIEITRAPGASFAIKW